MADEHLIPDNEETYEPDILTLEDETGKEFKFEVLDAADYNDTHYLAIVPYAESDEDIVEEDTELLLMRVAVDENNDEYLEIIEDEKELLAVSGVFEKRLTELYDIDPSDITTS